MFHFLTQLVIKKKPAGGTMFVKDTFQVKVFNARVHFSTQRQNIFITHQLPEEKEQPKAVLLQPRDIG